jgi:outer membrane protein TolC
MKQKSLFENSLFTILYSLFLVQAVSAQPEPAAETGPTRLLSMEEAIALALTNNLDILISQYNPIIDQFTLNGLASAYDPAVSFSASRSSITSPGGIDPQIGYIFPPYTLDSRTYDPGIQGMLPLGTTFNLTAPLYNQTTFPSTYSSTPAGITLSQPILKNFLIDNPRYQIQLSKKTLRSDQLALRLQIMTVVNNVKAAYYNLIYARENVKVERAAVDLARQLVDENTKKVQLGALAPLDQRQAESQAATSQADLLAAELVQATQENTFKSFLSLHLSDWAGVTPVPTETLLALPENPDLTESLRQALELRPDMIQAKITVEKQHLTIKYTRNQLYPELDLTGSYGRNADSLTFGGYLDNLQHGTYPSYSYGIVLTFPLENTGPRNNYHSAKAGLEQLLLQVKKVETTIVLAVDNDIKTVRSDYLRVDATRKAREYAEDALKAGQARLTAGSTTSFEVLQLQNNLTTARSAEIRALADYNIALEQLALDKGTILDRNHLDMKMP